MTGCIGKKGAQVYLTITTCDIVGALTGVNCFETYQFCKKGGGGFEYRKLKVGKIELLHCEDLITL